MFIEQQFSARKVLKYPRFSASCFYFKKTTDTPKNRGVKTSEFTPVVGGDKVYNSQVINQVKQLFEKVFVDYGYLKITYNL